MLSWNLYPDVLLGDLDSIKDKKEVHDLLQKKRLSLHIFPKKKDYTDLELALSYAKDYGVSFCEVLGATGSRLDHSFINLLLLKRFTTEGMETVFINKTNQIRFLLPGEHYFNRVDKEYYVSFIPLEDTNLDLKGFEYNLDSFSLKKEASIAISNHIIEDGARVRTSGGVFMFLSRD